jgi:hypothetical protein
MNLSNGNSFNGSSAYCAAADDRKVRTMPVLFLYLVPGYRNGWPA